jgi:hypothetical protein
MESIEKELAKIGMSVDEYEQCLSDIVDKLDGSLDIDWEELKNMYGIPYATDVLRKANGTLFGGYAVSKYYRDKYSKVDDISFTDQLYELKKEKHKVQTEKLELNKNLREVARDELITEHIKEAIATLPPIKIPKRIEVAKGDREYLLCFADCHYGIEFDIKDLFGNTINAYSPEIFEMRMSALFFEVLDTVAKEKIRKLSIWELGDAIQGMLRLNSQLMQLRYGVIESSILYAEYVANWLSALSEYVAIDFQMVADSNHNQLRLCGAPKNAFPDENMSKVINSFLKERLKNNPNITLTENPTGMNYGEFAGSKVLGIHGEVKDLSTAINDLSRAYNVSIDYVIAGHKHHAENIEVGTNAEAIHIRSIIGVDPFGMSLNRTSNAGASMFVFEEGKGKVCEYTYKLN